MADLATKENNITPQLCYCTLGTMRSRPIFLAPGLQRNKLHHPVKPKLTKRHIIALVKDTVLSWTRALRFKI